MVLAKLNQLSCPLDVHVPVFRQDAQYGAIHSRFFGVRDRALHLRKLSARIHEVSRAGPDHRKNGNAHPRACRRMSSLLGVMPPADRSPHSSMRSAPPRSAASAASRVSTLISSKHFRLTVKSYGGGDVS